MLQNAVPIFLAWESFSWTHFALYQLVPAVLVLCFFVGSLALRKQTKHLSVLTQVLASALMFFLVLLDMAISVFRPFDFSLSPSPWDTLDTVRSAAVISCVIVFPAAYAWYALTRKRL